jgi:hypothetical protein
MQEANDYADNDIDLEDDAEDWGDEEWDEEALGLEWNETETQNVMRDVIPARGFAD